MHLVLFLHCLTIKPWLLVVQECVLKLLAEKTVIMVTHQIDFLPAADLVIVRSKTLHSPVQDEFN